MQLVAALGCCAVGGLIGYNFGGTVETSYATGAVSTKGGIAGGLIGASQKSSTSSALIETSYATGPVASGAGLVGANATGSTISYSYWDTQEQRRYRRRPLWGWHGRDPPDGGAVAKQLQRLPLQPELRRVVLRRRDRRPLSLPVTSSRAACRRSSARRHLRGPLSAAGGLYYGGVLLGGGAVSPARRLHLPGRPSRHIGRERRQDWRRPDTGRPASPTGLTYTDAGSAAADSLPCRRLAPCQNAETTGELTLSALQPVLPPHSGRLRRPETARVSTADDYHRDGREFNAQSATEHLRPDPPDRRRRPTDCRRSLTLTGSGALGLVARRRPEHRRADLGHRRGPGGAPTSGPGGSPSISVRPASPARSRTPLARAKASPARR